MTLAALSFVGGRSFNMRLNGGKLFSVPFLCRDQRCPEALQFSLHEMLVERSVVGPASLQPSVHQTGDLALSFTLTSGGGIAAGVTTGAASVTLSLENLSTSALSASTESLTNAPLYFLTVLLLAEPPIILSTLVALNAVQSSALSSSSADGSDRALQNTRLKNFIEGVDPTKSIMELSYLLDEPFEEVELFVLLCYGHSSIMT